MMSPDLHSIAINPAPRTQTTLFSNARLVLPERVVEGWLAVADSQILALGEGEAPEAGIDLGGDYLIPGLVELHTDHLESHVQPRPKVRWDMLGAVLAYDAQIAASGITTVFDSLRVGSDHDGGGLGSEVATLAQTLEDARARRLLRADHKLHLRCEVPAEDVVEVAAQLFASHCVGLMSLMDHTPGQRQFRDIERFYTYATRHGASRAEVEAAGKLKLARAGVLGPQHRAALVALAQQHAVPLASHDDTTLADVAQSMAEGAALAEFPTTSEAARACREAGIAVMMGAPNLIRGGSHSGNVAAGMLAEQRQLDILSSDYVPASLLLAAFRLPGLGLGVSLPQAVAMCSRNPARAAGLRDRGEIAPGRLADLVRVELNAGQPVVRAVWRGGERVS